jgi:release factor glutamine methyltransferase
LSSDSAALVRAAARRIPQTDAEYLLESLLGRKRHEFYLGIDVPKRIAARFDRQVAKAQRGCPVQYLAGSAPFLDFEVRVDRRVLIPRPETEELVLRSLSRRSLPPSLHPCIPPSLHPCIPPSLSPLVLDFGTGSGCIAIAVARLLPRASVIAVDASRAALNVARENVRRLGVARRIRFVQARSLADRQLAQLRGKLDLLISNPPYVPTRRLARLPVSVRDHEPRLALDGGTNGTKIVAMLLEHGPTFLRPDGLMALEIDWSQGRFVRRLARSADIERDLAGRTRYAFIPAETAPCSLLPAPS